MAAEHGDVSPHISPSEAFTSVIQVFSSEPLFWIQDGSFLFYLGLWNKIIKGTEKTPACTALTVKTTKK